MNETPRTSNSESCSQQLSLMIEAILDETLPPNLRFEAVSTVCTTPPLRDLIVALQGDRGKRVMNSVYNLADGLREHSLPIYQRSLRLVRDMIRQSNVVPDAIGFAETPLTDCLQFAAGGNASLFTANHLVNGENEVVVLKLANTWADKGDDDAQERKKKKLIFESLLWRSLDHPNILPCLGVDIYTKPPDIGIVLPYMRNGSLMSFRSQINPADFNTRLYEVSQALLYLHKEGIIHGDLHGNNVLITDDGKAVLVDFGATDLAMVTQTSFGMHGTIGFLSPERLGGAAGEFEEEDTRPTSMSDVFAFAGLCYQLYSSEGPFASEPPIEATKAVLTDRKPPRPHDNDIPMRSYSVSDDIWSMMMDCWKFDAADRSLIDEVVSRLHKILRQCDKI